MKRIILVLGVMASTGFTFAYPSSASASASRPSLSSMSPASQSRVNYTGKDEDGNTEKVETGKKKGT
jgi:hypothetical protein